MRDLLILCYHAVSDGWPASLSLPAGQIEGQVSGLLDRGYTAATFTEAMRGGEGRSLAVTFDDGYRSIIDRGLPVLSRLGVPATVFVPTAYVGSERPMAWTGIDRWMGTPHEKELLPMGWDDLRALKDEGWEIGSHTCSHPRLPGLSDADLGEELQASRAAIEDGIGAPCTAIAYPYGDVDRRVAAAARDRGYEAGAGLAGYELGADPLRWPRIGVWREDSARRFGLKVSVLARRTRLAWARATLGYPFSS